MRRIAVTLGGADAANDTLKVLAGLAQSDANGYRAGTCPVAEDFAARAVSLPLYPALTDADADRVIDAVQTAHRAVL